ncbi:hypothetical protein KFL_002400240 [Klebsormidium nitens]|uniref:Uncharacterized protein n=1 Tax=Klebsormidium nitens TaxID=105231 RepID=A0A1Y1IBT0_KLENI|nr:hypothetical protein KFL_002400240 [Klebsormidium nitens]|eukprot:GAQ85548.1 hypothetical protein KFL_002400240 [Klebsormidium nitens]
MVEKQTRNAVESEEGRGFAVPLSLKSVDDYAEYFSQVNQDGDGQSLRKTKEDARRNLTDSLLEQHKGIYAFLNCFISRLEAQFEGETILIRSATVRRLAADLVTAGNDLESSVQLRQALQDLRRFVMTPRSKLVDQEEVAEADKEGKRVKKDDCAAQEPATWFLPFFQLADEYLKCAVTSAEMNTRLPLEDHLRGPQSCATAMLAATASSELRELLQIDGGGRVRSTGTATMIEQVEVKSRPSSISKARKQLEVNLRVTELAFKRAFPAKKQGQIELVGYIYVVGTEAAQRFMGSQILKGGNLTTCVRIR